MPPSVRLPDGRTASLRPDPIRTGSLLLEIDGSEQSLIDPAAPERLDLEYMARLGAVVDALGPAGAPRAVLHLGAGALSLARYVAATRPGSEQTVLERAAGLVDFVLAEAPLPAGARLRIVTADAAHLQPGPPADLVVLDVYDGDEIPEPFYRADVLARIAGSVAADGLLAINVADDADHRRLRRLRRGLAGALPVLAAVGPQSFAEGRGSGNAILLASRGDAASRAAVLLLHAGPHPVAAVADGDLVPVEVAVEVDP
ncbi:SAM-dependent methyltransferase [Rathayibacter sp. VKM Ac-2760]|uniref:spermidine synthase n=1 Tax=Rathayibacter sp. VKM Ac-2760 TaxID=2609253 RepID=UPI001317E53B|nr:SAM-dependent methyltransferase [Rathayibacter sp. VKM Ac-2760]QHC59784.1 SAM-dependent methyltransferase [Rathayibacter sp. VKM Ac-2760]